MEKLEYELCVTMCNLKRICPPAFFNKNMHLVVHLAEEAKITGHVQYRWMYSIEWWVIMSPILLLPS